MKLTTMERLKLLDTLPPQGDILTLKILRKLREALSFNEEELKTVSARHEYACPYRDSNGGLACDNKGFFSEAPKCATHNIVMVATGEVNIFIPTEVMGVEKEIHMGPQALVMASKSLKSLNDNERLTEAHVSLYEKFFPPEIEIPEIIEKSMGD